MADHNDPCEEFLQTRFPPSPSTALHDELLRQTIGMLRRRPFWRRTGWSTALAACYLAGLGSMWFLKPSPAVQVASQPEPKNEEIIPPKPTPEPLSPSEVDETGVPALVLERRGDRVAKPLRTAFYRRAGNRYLVENDMAGALRCYRRALDYASPRELAIDAEDNWLLIALKDARMKEETNVPNDG